MNEQSSELESKRSARCYKRNASSALQRVSQLKSGRNMDQEASIFEELALSPKQQMTIQIPKKVERPKIPSLESSFDMSNRIIDAQKSSEQKIEKPEIQGRNRSLMNSLEEIAMMSPSNSEEVKIKAQPKKFLQTQASAPNESKGNSSQRNKKSPTVQIVSDGIEYPDEFEDFEQDDLPRVKPQIQLPSPSQFLKSPSLYSQDKQFTKLQKLFPKQPIDQPAQRQPDHINQHLIDMVRNNNDTLEDEQWGQKQDANHSINTETGLQNYHEEHKQSDQQRNQISHYTNRDQSSKGGKRHQVNRQIQFDDEADDKESERGNSNKQDKPGQSNKQASKNESHKKKAEEARIQGENDQKNKYSVSIDQFKKMQKVKNPISSGNLVLIALMYFIAIGLSFPLSYKGIDTRNCDMEARYIYHLSFLGLVILVLIPSDGKAFFSNDKIQEILSQQNFQIVENQRSSNLCGSFGSLLISLLSVICTGTQLYELYTDLLIIWVSLYSSLPFTFGFFAVAFPLINRLVQLTFCTQMFIYGMKLRVKTISPAKIDKILIILSFFNMSRLLYPSFHEQTPKFLMIILAKECALKLVQIILKLILATQTLSNECQGNIGLLVLTIFGNLMSLMQMIFFMTDRFTTSNQKQDEEEFMRIGDMEQYVVAQGTKFEVVIDNKNQDIILRLMNAYVFQKKNKIRSMSISFQNQTQLIQPQYRECMLKMITNCQQNNQKLRELKIQDSNLNLNDFTQLRQIITVIPKLETLVLENFIITDREFECMEQLKYGIERNKHFRDLYLKYKTSNKHALFLNQFKSLFNLNKNLSISFVNHCSELNLPQNFKELRIQQRKSEILKQAPKVAEIAPSLYDEVDLAFFVSCRQSHKNYKLFTFRDWENLLRRLYLQKSKNIVLSDLQTFEMEKQSKQFKQQNYIFIHWLIKRISCNPQLANLSFRFIDTEQSSAPGFKMLEKNKFCLDFEQQLDILDKFCEFQDQNPSLQLLEVIYNSDQAFKNIDKINLLMTRIQKLQSLQELCLQNINLQEFPLIEHLAKFSNKLVSIKLQNCHMTSLKDLNLLISLRIVKFSCNQIDFTKDENNLVFLLTNLLSLELSNQQLDIDESSSFFNEQLSSRLELLQMKSLDVKNKVFKKVVQFLMKNAPSLSIIDFEDNLITDEGLKGIKFSKRIQKLDLSNNSISTEGAFKLIQTTKIKEISLNENKIASLKLFNKVAQTIGLKEESPITHLHLSKQTMKKATNAAINVNIRPFKHLVLLNLSCLQLQVNTVLDFIEQIQLYKPPIRSLDLSGNNVGYQGCKSLNLLAQRNKTLKILKLDNSKIQCIGLSYLWLAFSDQDDTLELEHLSVKGNGINDQWAKRLNYKLSQPIKVKRLDLSENQFGDVAAKEIQLYFMDNQTVQSLNLGHNLITREGLRKLKEIIKLNSNIQELIVKGNKDIDESIEMCERSMRAKETFQRIVYY